MDASATNSVEELLSSVSTAVYSMKCFKFKGISLLNWLKWFCHGIESGRKDHTRFSNQIQVESFLTQALIPTLQKTIKLCTLCQKGKIFNFLLFESIAGQFDALEVVLGTFKDEVPFPDGIHHEPDSILKLREWANDQTAIERAELITDLNLGAVEDFTDVALLYKNIIQSSSCGPDEINLFKSDLREFVREGAEDSSLSQRLIVQLFLGGQLDLIQSNQAHLLDECHCPITHDLMTDPVILESGHTYERTAIEHWISKGNRTDPKTGIEMKSMKVIPNISLKNICGSLTEPEPQARGAPSSRSGRSMQLLDSIPPVVAEYFSHVNTFKVSQSCRLVISTGDITKWFINGNTDAIVNAANERMLGGGGVDGAIHSAAGPGLREQCLKVPEVSKGVRCPTGTAVSTSAGRLRVKFVIHTVGPVYGTENSRALLYNSYKNSIQMASSLGVEYIAFPAISCGIYSYPVDEAAGISIQAVRENLKELKEIHFILFSTEIHIAWVKSSEEAFGSPLH